MAARAHWLNAELDPAFWADTDDGLPQIEVLPSDLKPTLVPIGSGAGALGRLFPTIPHGYAANDAQIAPPRPRLRLPKKMQGLFKPSRFKVLHGGRGSAKSHSVARTLLYLAAMKPLRILCGREYQASISDSVHRLLVDIISADPWLAARYDVQKNYIQGPAGSLFLFAGIRNNITKIKSMEGIDICWVEEAEVISAYSWEVLIPTIRKKGSEIWVTFNPGLETDPTSQMFLVNPRPDAWVQEVNWNDNPFFPEELRKEKDYLYRIDPEAADHVWGGKYRKNSAATVLRGKYRVEAFVAEPDWDGPYYGADWGYSVDPSTLVKCFIHKNILYIHEEAYGVGVDIDKTPELFAKVGGSAKARIRADSARPETISYMQRHGYPGTIAAVKWPGSVEDGVAFLRSFEAIVIHPRCVHAVEEARLWSWKVDRLTQDVLTVLEDKHNHIWDAVRYALEPIIRQANLGMLNYMKSLVNKE